MWTKAEKGLDPLFIGPSRGHSHLEIGEYFKYQVSHSRVMTSPSSCSPTGSCVLWKGNTARRKRFEPFCSPIAPHVPIRRRLTIRGRCSSEDANAECDQCALSASNPYLSGRRRRMSLLQSLRYQNKQLADSGFEIHQAERSERDLGSPTNLSQKRYSDSPPSSAIEEEDVSKLRPSSFTKLKAKTCALFGRKNIKKQQNPEKGAYSEASSRCCASDNENAIYSSIDLSAKETRHRKSLSTNDSGHGSQGRLCIDEENTECSNDQCETRETVAVIERRPHYNQDNQDISIPIFRTQRSLSCPQFGSDLRIFREMIQKAASLKDREHPELWGWESEEDFILSARGLHRLNEECRTASPARVSQMSEEVEGVVEKEEIKFAERILRCSTPNSLTSSDPGRRQQGQRNLKRPNGYTVDSIAHLTTSLPSPPRSLSSPAAESSKSVQSPDDMNNNDDVSLFLRRLALDDADIESVDTRASEDIDEDSASTVLLDQYLPILSEICQKEPQKGRRSSSASSNVNRSEEDDDSTTINDRNGKVGSVTQTDLSLVRISEQLNSYLAGLGLLTSSQQRTNKSEGMNFLAKHFFEYQSFINLPHKAVQLHKPPSSQAGSDPSAGWAPKSMNKAGKNQAAPGARANRNNADTRQVAHRHGRAGKHEFREWGDRHGELKSEKTAPHKDAWTKFLSNEEMSGSRTIFECDFEDRILQTEPETLPERLARTERSGDDFALPYPVPVRSANSCETEVLTILTYAPQVQFVTATVKKAKNLPFNNRPFARVMLFEGRRLLEQKQTTITPTATCNGCVSSCSRAKPVCSISSTSSSSVSSTATSSKSNDAVFSESFLFHVSPQMLDRSHIVIEIYDSDPADPERTPVPIGHCVVGPMCTGTGCAHWLQMVHKSGLPVCMWHRVVKN